ncbi:MAG: 2-hydroxyhepta-2,4-diene-1,7-dioate isomerase, partial [Gammaproteobacteria bacterium]|nr:2-hydroxyhepta-2,4-diene-1,7-dioate isomerase [Gammaproteobacteria bacterium]
AYVSTIMPLEPGDVIATGTPTGVGAKLDPPTWLKAGDLVEIEVSGVGVLRNTVEDEQA